MTYLGANSSQIWARDTKDFGDSFELPNYSKVPSNKSVDTPTILTLTNSPAKYKGTVVKPRPSFTDAKVLGVLAALAFLVSVFENGLFRPQVGYSVLSALTLALIVGFGELKRRKSNK